MMNLQSKLTFHAMHKFCNKECSSTFRYIELLIYRPINLSIVLLEKPKLLMYETNYEKLQRFI